MTVEQFIKLVEKLKGTPYINMDDHPATHDKVYDKALADAFRQAKLMYMVLEK